MEETINVKSVAKKKNRDPVYILAALVGGIVFDYLFPEIGVTLRPIGDAFIKMIKMIIVPLVFATLICGIAEPAI